jgi:hypothetical protein
LPWLATTAAATSIELVWWAVVWWAGLAPAPYVGAYLALACGALAAALIVRRIVAGTWTRASWLSVILATLMIAMGASLFLPLKYAIPYEVPFWLDVPVASAERSFFGAQPWSILDHLFGSAAVPLDRLYSLWLPVQSLVLFLILLQRPSPAKARALIAYSLAWFLLGVAAAAICSSAGPLFYDRLFGGHMFAPLHETLHARGAWVALAESNAMWASLATAKPGLVAGISAVPSMHVAISLWIYLAARSMAPRVKWVAALYLVLITIGSVQLGWHYVSDSVAAVLGMLLIWKLASRVPLLASKALVRAGVAERVGFEPTVSVNPRRFSRPLP